MIGSIRKWMFDKSIKEHQNYKLNYNRSGVNHCNSICLLSYGTQESCKKESRRYMDRMTTMGKKVDVIYYYDQKDVVEDGYSNQNVKWNGIPNHETIDSILNKDYDLFIFICPFIDSHLEYITTLSKAKFKIGPNFENKVYLFDLMIDIQDLTDTSSLLKNIDNQLKILSS